MSTKSREVIWGGRIMGAGIRARGAREDANRAIREADRAEAHAWSVRMEGYGGSAQPSPTIQRCLNGGFGWLEVKCSRCESKGQHSARRDPATATHADLETGGIVQMSIMPTRSICAAGSYDQADREPGDHAVSLGASR